MYVLLVIYIAAFITFCCTCEDALLCVADGTCCGQVDCYTLADCKLAYSDRCRSSPVRCAVGTSSRSIFVQRLSSYRNRDCNVKYTDHDIDSVDHLFAVLTHSHIRCTALRYACYTVAATIGFICYETLLQSRIRF